ncbi:MAG TPA: winged helix-turn-helix domain-containing protein [Burkholderiaceae bacterium]|nr:winged helix-turn-helix domain-containing protein [Burkholderiaceae bacterium]
MDTPATSNAVQTEYRFGRFRLIPGEHLLLVDGEPANLGARAFSLLVLLVERAGQLVSKDEILSRVWPGLVVEENNLQVQISTLRKVLGHEAIATIPAVGYRFVLALEPRASSPAAEGAARTESRELATVGAAELSSALKTGRRRTVAAAFMGVLIVVAVALWMLPQLRKVQTQPAPPMSMAVLPFTAVGGDRTEEQLADDLTRDLTIGLGRVRSALVVSHSLALTYKGRAIDPRAVGRDVNVRYLVEGAVRREGERIAVMAQLIDAAAATQVWSDRLELEQVQVIQRQAAMVAQLTERLRVALYDAEKRRIGTQRSPGANAMEISLRAYNLWDREINQLKELKGALEARKLFDEALRLDPNLMHALVGRARTVWDELELNRDADHERLVQELDQLSNRAVAVDSNDASAWEIRTVALARQFRWDAALEANARAIKLDPTRARLVQARANLMGFMGKPAEILPLVDQALALDPLDMGWAMRLRCRAHLLLGRYRDAVAACEKAVPFDDTWITHLYLTAAYSHEGEVAKAEAAKAALLQRRPGFVIADIRAGRFSDVPAYWEQVETHVFAGLRKAGIPEQQGASR